MNDFFLPSHDFSDDTDSDFDTASELDSVFPPPPAPVRKSGPGIGLAQVLARANVARAWEKVRRNKGCAGVDGWRISQIEPRFDLHWAPVADAVAAGKWQPQPLRRVEIAKPDGGKRVLAIPAVLDRVLLQAISQVLAPLWQPGFAAASHAYQPGKGALGAVEAARGYFQACLAETGQAAAWHLDVRDFFDSAPHAPLLARLEASGVRADLLEIVRRGLAAPLLGGLRLETRTAGLPQGSPLSPLLANIVLDPFDHAQAAAGRAYARYADDMLLFPAPGEAPAAAHGEAMRLLAAAGLQLNQGKTRLTGPAGTTFLGYGFWEPEPGAVALRVSPEALAAAETQLERIATPRPDALGAEIRRRQAVEFLRGWLCYYRASELPEDIGTVLALARERLGVTPDMLGAGAGASPGPGAAGFFREGAAPTGTTGYGGFPTPPRDTMPAGGGKLAAAAHWAGRLMRNGVVRCGLELGSKRGSWVPRPTAFKVNVFGHSITFRL